MARQAEQTAQTKAFVEMEENSDSDSQGSDRSEKHHGSASSSGDDSSGGDGSRSKRRRRRLDAD
eukprot:CAMPEP_0185595220 /NCGR_PEP_ID=MMETSP0434-20130131/77637_1 /TAXON_ID=626734 ORGANISM="Favella taraikaensis, Strain Fe Narragansett Bay" /NCGR_SAMPLE_ID=MMETSP0434 /ASSEMBLY_ACC=CAM_ASM_000379 /LENGTH=63 /DNA_ID=CAMNT_0028223071 /DNA_START=51 /DNA_END=242 /DNA_ORIENTATION=+